MRFDRVFLAAVAVCAALTFGVQARAAQDDGKNAVRQGALAREQVGAEGPQEVLRRQLDAVRGRNEESAYAYISPSLKEKYEDAGSFFKALRFSYRPLYKHMSVSFLDGREEGDVSFQKIEVTGPEKDPHVVLVRMSRQEGDRWLVDGYAVLEAEQDPL